MKKILCSIMLICLVLNITACSAVIPKEDIAIEDLPELSVDADRKDLIPYKDLEQIKEGMTLKEVYSIAGKPQYYKPLILAGEELKLSGMAGTTTNYWVYESVEGGTVYVLYERGSSTNGIDTDLDNVVVKLVFKVPLETEDLSAALDVEMTHKPTNEETRQITNGMRMSEVVEILGKPHRRGNDIFLTVEWTTVEGETFKIMVMYSDDFNDISRVDMITKYGVVRILKTVRATNSQK